MLNLRRLSLATIAFCVVGLAGLLTYAELNERRLQRSALQVSFSKGTYPQPAPNGFYVGSVPGLERLSWKGKRFDAATSSGINIFVQQGQQKTIYPFKTSRGSSELDPRQQVFRIDYNHSSNPWWVRLYLDEVVAIAPGRLLGKLIIRLIPGRPYAILFFELRQPSSRPPHGHISFPIKKNALSTATRAIQ
jgi:hypothetical protein